MEEEVDEMESLKERYLSNSPIFLATGSSITAGLVAGLVAGLEAGLETGF